MHKRVKRENEKITYKVEFSRALESIWYPGYSYASGEYVRPPHADGYEYECTSEGQSAHDEPNWPAIIGETTTDGSVVWTCRNFSYNASDTVSSHQILSDAGVVIEDSTGFPTRVDVTVSGGTAGEVYDVIVKVTTAAGEIYTETIRITVGE